VALVRSDRAMRCGDNSYMCYATRGKTCYVNGSLACGVGNRKGRRRHSLTHSASGNVAVQPSPLPNRRELTLVQPSLCHRCIAVSSAQETRFVRTLVYTYISIFAVCPCPQDTFWHVKSGYRLQGIPSSPPPPKCRAWCYSSLLPPSPGFFGFFSGTEWNGNWDHSKYVSCA
jgi:hypothetical protein